MKQKTGIIRGFALTFGLTGFLFVAFGLLSLYQLHTLSGLTRTIYDHPLVVSNAALQANARISDIHRNLKDAVLSHRRSEIQSRARKIINLEEQVLYQLKLIQGRILGREGELLADGAILLMREWRPMRDHILETLRRGDRKTAWDELQNSIAHMEKLETRMQELTDYARNKADGFMADAEAIRAQALNVSAVFLLSGIFVSLAVALAGLKKTRASEKALLESEQRFRRAFEVANDGICLVRPDGSFAMTNLRLAEILGYEQAELETLNVAEVTHLDDREESAAVIRDYNSGWIDRVQMEKRYVRKDGEIVWARVSSAAVRGEDGELSHFVTHIQDITARKEAERALVEQEAFNRSILENLPVGIAVNSVDPQVEFSYMNENFLKCYRVTRAALNDPDAFWNAVYEEPAFREEMRKQVLSDCESGDPERMQWNDVPITRRGRETRYISAKNTPVPDRGLMISTVWDVTDRVNAERAVRESEKKYRDIFENALEAFFRSTPEGQFIDVNPAFARMLGYESPSEMMEAITDIGSQLYADPDDRRRYRKILAEHGTVEGMEYRIRRKDGTAIWVSNSTRVYFDEDGEVLHYEGILTDVTGRKREEAVTGARLRLLQYSSNHCLEDLLRESLRELETLTESRIGFYHYVDDRQNTVQLGAWSESTLAGFCSAKADSHAYDLDRAGVWVDCVRQRRPVIFNDYESLPHKKGLPEGHAAVRCMLAVPVFRDSRITAVVGVGNKERDYTDADVDVASTLADLTWDIAQRKRAEEEAEALEGQLNQARKMESIGTLSGGVAHEFNNILSIILGNAELALDDVADWNPLHEFLREIRNASLRGKDIVRQLLSFSRKGAHKKKPLRLYSVVNESIGFLRAAIPSNIALEKDLDEASGVIMGDATQIHQVLINLCGNAAQAMEEEGGTIGITVRNVNTLEPEPFFDKVFLPGRYAALTVRDTGHGIPEELLERVFDPFFSTKEVHKGTGMGLAVVHGIVNGHGGGIRVHSTVAQGTVFECWFPLADAGPVEEGEENQPLPSGTETVLLVDDEAPLVKIGRHHLERLGYTVRASTDPLAALEIFKSDPGAVDLIVTDMTMPHMTGDRLVQEALAVRPDVKAIICSGYNERIGSNKAAEIGAAAYLLKPMDRQVFARTVRRVLDGKQE